MHKWSISVVTLVLVAQTHATLAYEDGERRLSVRELLELDSSDAFSVAPSDIIAACDQYFDSENVIAPSVRARLLWWRMRSSLRVEDWGSALADANAYLTLKPNDIGVNVARIRLISQLQGLEPAIAEAEDLLKAHPESSQVRAYTMSVKVLAGDLDAEDYFVALKGMDDDSAIVQYFVAAYYRERDELSKALFHMDKYIAIKSLNEWQHPHTPYLERGDLHRRMGHPELALKDFLIADRLNPDAVAPRLRIISAYYEKRRFHLALRLSKELASKHPASGEAHACLGDVLYALGRPEGAARSYECAIVNGVDGQAMFAIAAAVWLTAGDYERAFTNIQRGRKRRPQELNLIRLHQLFLAASPIEKHRDGEKAIRLAEDVCEATQFQDAWWLFHLAVAKAEMGKYEEAIELCERTEMLGDDPATIAARQTTQIVKPLFRAKKPYRLQKEDNPIAYSPSMMRIYLSDEAIRSALPGVTLDLSD